MPNNDLILSLSRSIIVVNVTVKDFGVNTTHKLYTTKHNVIDFNADDNGLWLIHSSLDSNYTIVTKINETTLAIQNSFNISVFHDKVNLLPFNKF